MRLQAVQPKAGTELLSEGVKVTLLAPLLVLTGEHVAGLCNRRAQAPRKDSGMPDHFLFSYRIVLLLGLMLVVSLVDFYRNGTRAVKFREYGFVIIAGVAGAMVGGVNDLITSSISPDYFILGKGMEASPNLRMQAGQFGLQVGFSAGVIGGAACLYASRRKSAHPPASFPSLFRLLWMPVAGAVLGGVTLPLGFSKFDPARFSVQLGGLLNAERIDRFRQVWWIHIGLYAGMIVGLMMMILRTVKERKRSFSGVS